MREYKFRGKRKDNSEWVYGDIIYRKCDGILKAYIYDNSWDETEIDDYDEDGVKRLKDLFIEVIHKSVGQYTGLKDSNGKEIYEGDILKEENSIGYSLYEIKFGFYDNGESYEDSESGYGWHLNTIKIYNNFYKKFETPFEKITIGITTEEQFHMDNNNMIVIGNIFEDVDD